MHIRRFRTALPALCLCFAPLLAAADCPGGSVLGGGQPHHGDWVADDSDGVTFYRFGANGDMIWTMEVYSRAAFLDEMKLEVHATCTKAQGSKPEPDGTYELRCENEQAVRGSNGIGSAFGALNAVGDIFGAPRGLESVLKVRRDGERLVVTRIPHERGKRAKSRTFEPVETSRSDAFLERFREGTMVIPESKTETRERDLP